MKTIITSVFALFFSIVGSHASNLSVKGTSNYQQSLSAAVSAQEFEQFLTTRNKNKFAPIADRSIFDPSMVVVTDMTKAEAAKIAEDRQITESVLEIENYSFFSNERSAEKVIRENNDIIESTTDLSFKPLFLEKTIEQKIFEDQLITEAPDFTNQLPLNLTFTQKSAVVTEN